MNYDHKEIILANPNYPDQNIKKYRPLLIISSKKLHDNSDFVICVGITTNQTKSPFLIPIKNNDYELKMLKEKSQIMCHRIATIKKTLIVKKLTRIKPSLYNNVTNKIRNDIIQI